MVSKDKGQPERGYQGMSQKDKTYTLQNLMNKLNKAEPVTFANYSVNFSEMFPQETNYKE